MSDLLQPVGAFDPKTGLWQLVWPYTVTLSDGLVLTVQPPFCSDGASIPRFMWPFVGPRYSADTFAASFVHDVLYAVHVTSRSWADREFARLLLRLGAGPRRVAAYYASVRLCGWWPWRNRAESERDAARLLVSMEHVYG